MEGLIAVYIALGVFFFAIFEDAYRDAVKPDIIRYIAFLGLCVFCWPWIVAKVK